MLDFKLNYYFEKYKDTSMVNRDRFRQKFRKENGKFNQLEDLIVMIEIYQRKKYGSGVDRGDFVYCRSKEERQRVNANYRREYRRRLGK